MGRDYPIPVTAGGKLLSQPSSSLENIGDANYSVKINFRRQNDQEIRREGWVKFRPNAGQPVNQQYIWDGALKLVMLAELVQPAGNRVIVGASATTIKAFNTATSSWTEIGSGFNAGAARWQVETINGYLILNNTVDLPVSYQYGDAAVTPLYEMRDVGIAAVGRIKEFNGFLFCGNLTYIDSNQLNPWMVGYPNFVPSGTVNENVNFASDGSDGETQYDVTTGAGEITLTLPVVQPPPTWWILLKKVDAGAGSVVTSPVLGDQLVDLVNINDTALIWSDGTNFFAKYFPAGVIPATNPYGIPPADIVNVVPYDVAWSSFGAPTNWAPIYSCYMPAASATIDLPFATPVLKVGDLVAVINGGPDGGVLGGQTNYPLGVPITEIVGNAITLAESTDVGNTYPRVVQVLRFADIGTLVGKFSCQGDGSRIIGMSTLQGKLMIYKDTSIFIGKYVAITGQPFQFNEKFDGYMQPIWGDAIVSINGQYHLYPGQGNRFYVFDGITYPVVHAPTDGARDLFFSGINSGDAIFAIDNPLTREHWFCRPGLVFAFDYITNTVGIIDTEIDAVVFCQRPLSLDKWMVLGIGGNVYTYGLVNGATLITTWLRDGQPAVPVISSGLMTMGNQNNEKLVTEYIPLLSSSSPDMEFSVQISLTFNPSAPPVAQFNPAADLPDPQGNNFLPVALQAIYFQDLITVTDDRDMNVSFSGRLMTVAVVKAGSVTRTSN